MNPIDGRALAATIRQQIKQDVADTGITPVLAVLLVGDDAASQLYVSLKEKAAAEAGIETRIVRLPADTSDARLIAQIEDWNRDETVDAILIQLPLPAGRDTDALIQAMDPAKDVDGFHPDNAARLLAGEATLFPPVHEGILRLIGATSTDLRSAKAVVLANSDVFADPLEHLLKTAGCFVDVFTPSDMDPEIVQAADIIVAAVGRPRFVTRGLVKSDACLIDVGTNTLPDGRVVGDIDTDNMKDVPGWYSPVPGGVGPMTVALLLKNTLALAQRRRSF